MDTVGTGRDLSLQIPFVNYYNTIQRTRASLVPTIILFNGQGQALSLQSSYTIILSLTLLPIKPIKVGLFRGLRS